MKKAWKFLSSMRFAIILLVILAVVCSLGSFITQGQTYAWYASRYSERTAALIIALHLDDAFHSWWFILISSFLCINLIACNVVRVPGLIKRTKSKEEVQPSVRAEGVKDVQAFFTAMGMKKPSETTRNGHKALYSSKNTIGIWGAWICHVGVLLLILGYGLGQMTYKEYTVYGVPGTTMVAGDTNLAVTIDDFHIDYREDGSVEQYTSDLTVRDLTGNRETRSASVSVNNPADIYGLRFYQNSTGWAARVKIQKDGEDLQESVVCAGDILPVSDKPELVILFNSFYPDVTGYLYSVYFQGRILGMNILLPEDVLTIDEYTVTFSEPQTYTLIQIKRDSFTFLAFIGGIVIMAGLFLAFYIQPRKIWAEQQEDGSWTVYGHSPKGGLMFKEQFKNASD